MMMLEHLAFLIFLYIVKMKKKRSFFNNVWEHAIDIVFKLSPLHPDDKSLRKWVKHQNMDDMEMLYRWDENHLSIGELSTSFLENSWDKGNPEFLKTNSIKNLHMLWKYLHHQVRGAQESPSPGNPFSILFPDQFFNLTWKQDFIQAQNPSGLVVTRIVVYKIYFTSIYIFYILFTSRQSLKIQESRKSNKYIKKLSTKHDSIFG